MLGHMNIYIIKFENSFLLNYDIVYEINYIKFIIYKLNIPFFHYIIVRKFIILILSKYYFNLYDFSF
jgi:hypothetical protein